MTQGVFTLLYNEEYLAGALVLAIALRKILERQPEVNISLGVIIDKGRLNDSQVSLLQNLYDDIIEVEQLESDMDHRLTYDLGRPELKQTFTKIQLWSLTKYDKILYLDADTLPNVPKDESQGSILDLLKLDFAAKKVLAAPDSGFPDIFNSGVMLLKPNMSDYTNLLNLIEESRDNRKLSFDGADQGLLNQYFNLQPDWVRDLVSSNQTEVAAAHGAKSSNWIPLPFLYNVTPSTEYEYLPAYKHFASTGWLSTVYGSLGRGYSNLLPHFNGEKSQIKLVHFIGPVKPWKAELSIGIYGQWWDTWYGYFGNVTVEEVVYHGGGDLVVESSSFEDRKETQIQSVETPPMKTQQSDQFDPSYLCDPTNYQHIPSTIVPSVDASWDPANEPPPAAKPVKHETVELERGMKSFTNAWDSSDEKSAHEDSHAPTYEGVQLSTETQRPSDEHYTRDEHPTVEQSTDNCYTDNDSTVHRFGYHASQRPERVFADDNVVLPHPYMPQSTSDNVEPAPSSTPPTSGQLEHEEIYNTLANLQIDQANADSLDQHPDQDSPQDSPQDDTPVAKLFPWEFNKEQHVPERTFD